MKYTTQNDTHSTRTRLLDAAEKLFADNGFEGTSLRAITAAAEANLAGVHYHFGSKEALSVEVFRRRIEPINRERLDQLTKLEAQAGSPTLEDVLATFLGPVLPLSQSEPGTATVILKLYASLHAEPEDSPFRINFFAMFHEVFERYLAVLSRLVPHLTAAECTLRFQFLIGAMAHSMCHTGMLHRTGCPAPGNDPNAFLNGLVSFAAAGFRAPATLQGGPQ